LAPFGLDANPAGGYIAGEEDDAPYSVRLDRVRCRNDLEGEHDRGRAENEAMSAGRILVVDDDPEIRRVMRVMLTGHGYELDDAMSGETALRKLRKLSGQHPFDLVLLDMNMPGVGGLRTCRSIRQHSEIAIIMLTVRDTESDKVEALDAGADDYITKPFKTPELLARIRAVLRRLPGVRGTGRLVLGAVEVDFDARRVTTCDRSVRLTPREFEVLCYLVAHPNRALRHLEILQAAWGPDYADDVEALRVVINQLRKKIEAQPSKPVYLLTEPWVGYRLCLLQGELGGFDEACQHR
jgi:two-component system, OmpR family, KDP operon response regulator KdpE